MRIAIMADIHGNHTALETCVEEARRRGAEEYLFLGDYLGEMAYPERTLEQLEKLRREYPCTFIRGNKENYWIDRLNGSNADWAWETGSSSTGILEYVYSRLEEGQIRWFEQMHAAKTMEYPGLPPFVICHGSPWKVNESMREDYPYIDELTGRLETELTVCGHFHIQGRYSRNGHRVINPGAVGVALRSGGQAQFMILSGTDGQWEESFITLPYDRGKVIREMQEEGLPEKAPCWYRVTKQVLTGGTVTHVGALSRAVALCKQETGVENWRNVPEKYWEMAMEEMGIGE